MTALPHHARVPRPILFLASMAVGAAIGATGIWLFISFADAALELAPSTPASVSEEAERLALTMLATSVAALAILSGLAALALERSEALPRAQAAAPTQPRPALPPPAAIVWREAMRLPEAPRRALERLDAV